MKLKLLKLRDALTESFWFLPAVMALLAACAAVGTVAIDEYVGADWFNDFTGLWGGSADGARAVLSVIAGSIMTVVSIVFSLTVTTLAQASSHFGTRVLRNFTSDRAVQFTLGTFIATFIYCLLVLRTVRSVEESGFVPYLSINIGVLLALASLAVLIFFIHRISQSIQAENLIADVGLEFQKLLPDLFPERDEDAPDESCEEPDWEDAERVEGSVYGYLQRVDEDQLMLLATTHDLSLKLEKRPGEFLAGPTTLLRAHPSSRVTDALRQRFRACFSHGRHRTPHQDPLYVVQQLVEIAAHGLSPGINEPFTALACIDWIGASLGAVVARDLRPPLRYDQHGRLRITGLAIGFDELARAAFDQLRLYGATNFEVMARLFEVIGEIAPKVARDADRRVLIDHVRVMADDAGAQIANVADRKRIADCARRTLDILSRSPNEES